jgi:hypothetical protein
MKQDDRDYETHIRALKHLLNQDSLNYKNIDKEIDAIISVKKGYTNDLRLESNRATRGIFEQKLAQHDEEVRGILSASSTVIQTSSRAKVLSELIERSTLYSHHDGKGNTQLIAGAQGTED